MRESPALEITREIRSLYIEKVMVYEPYANAGQSDFPPHDLDTVGRDAEILVVLVDHADFIGFDRVGLK